jgi:DNA-binding transcriptional MocR family regulator
VIRVNVYIVTMTIWHPTIQQSKSPKYLAIANAIEDDVNRGRLHPGDRLPPQRELADQLGVTVGTVTRGYAEAERRGLTRGETGRGTFVTSDVAAQDFLTIPNSDSHGFVDLSLVFPLYSEDPDLRSSLKSMAKRSSIQGLLQYQMGKGAMRHREAGVSWLKKTGLKPHVDDILICSGGQHGLTVLLGTLFKPGDRLLVEELTYPGIKQLAAMFEIRLEPVAMDEHGILPEALESVCTRERVKGLYTISTLQNPTTATLSDKRREQIASICERHGLWIIEDDCYALTMQDPPLPLYTYAAERTFFICSLSKTVAAGLRTAFLLAPRKQVKRLESAITHTIWMASPILAELAAMWIEDGTADAVLDRKRVEALARNSIAEQCLKGIDYRTNPTSYFIWVDLPDPWTGRDLQQEALSQGVGLVSVEQFLIGNAALPRGTRLALSAPPSREALTRGLTIIADILSAPPSRPAMIF